MHQTDPTDVESYERKRAEVTVGGAQPLPRPIEIVDHDPDLPTSYTGGEPRIRAALRSRVVRIEHVGSTSIPGPAAKPFVDIAPEVPNSALEHEYAPDLIAAGGTFASANRTGSSIASSRAGLRA